MSTNSSEKIIIVGAGIAGLRTALNLKKKYPQSNINILEKYAQPGGRMETIFINNDTHYESGAGRIHSSHKTLLKLIKKYKLTTTKLPDESYWKTPESNLKPNGFFSIWHELCVLFKQLPEKTLQIQTLRYLTIEMLGVELSKKQQTSDWGIEKLSDKQLEYAASDVLYLHRLKEKFDEMLTRENRMEMFQACVAFLPYRASLDLIGYINTDIFSH